MKLTLIGYMGSGKSAVGKQLAHEMNRPFIDLDTEIESRAQTSISKIFKTKGEVYFRKLEKNILDELLLANSNYIISLGGGTPVYYNNMEMINQYSESIFLKTSVSELVKRLEKEMEARPLLAHIPPKNLKEYVSKHLFERNPFYTQAQYQVSTDHKNPEEISGEIIRLLDRPLPL